jgi:PAS domain S-box-containing protein
MIHKNLLKILFVEDLPSDADLEVLELRKEGLRFEHMRVDTRDELIKALKEFKPDIVISDYMMPSYNGMQALKDAHELDPLVPFILCTGSMNEETAVECLKAGANDYIIKEHLTRLPFAVKEVLEQHRIQVEKRAAELLLKESEEKLQSIFSAAPVGIGLVVNRVFMEVNDTFCKMTGYSRKELIGKNAEMIYATTEEYESVGIAKYSQIAEEGIGSVETRFKCKDGRILNIFLSLAPLDKDDLPKGVTFSVLDITERKRAEEALMESEAKWRTLVTTIPEYIGLVDCEGKFLFLNHYAEGFSEKDTVGKSHLDFIPNEWKEFYGQKFEKCMSTQKNQIFEYTAFGDNNAIRTYETCLVPIIQQGKVSNVMAITRDITERKQTEDILRNSEERLKILFDYAPDAYYLNDLRGNFIDGNIAAEKLLGYNKNELIGKSFLKLNILSLKQLPGAAKLLVKNALGQGTGPDEFVLSRKDGSKVTVEIITHPVKIKDKTLVLGIARDITERKMAEEAMQVKDWAIESAINGMVTTDMEGNLNFVNPAFLKMWKYNSPEEVLGKPAVEFWQMGEKAAEVMESMRTKGGWIGELVARGKDGDFFNVQVVASIVVNDTGQPVCMYSSFADITERKRAEEAILESESRFRALFETSNDGILVADIETKNFKYANPSICRILGYTENELITMNIAGIHPKDALQSVISEFEAQARGEKVLAESLPCIRKDGTILYMDVNAGKIIINGKEYNAGFFRDITGRKQAEDKVSEQLDELRRWYDATADREEKILEVKREVNELLIQAGKPPRYESVT